MATNRIKKTSTVIPQTIPGSETFLISIGNKQRLINELKRDAKAKKDAIDATLKSQVESVTKERDTFFTALFAFAQPRKASLTQVIKSVIFATGSFGWRFTPPKVTIKNGMTDADLIGHLEKKGYLQYVRVIKEVDREALLRDKPQISCVTYTQQEEFFAKPKLKKGEGSAEELVKMETETIDVKV